MKEGFIISGPTLVKGENDGAARNTFDIWGAERVYTGIYIYIYISYNMKYIIYIYKYQLIHSLSLQFWWAHEHSWDLSAVKFRYMEKGSDSAIKTDSGMLWVQLWAFACSNSSSDCDPCEWVDWSLAPKNMSCSKRISNLLKVLHGFPCGSKASAILERYRAPKPKHDKYGSNLNLPWNVHSMVYPQNKHRKLANQWLIHS